jgi:hypothetical protein
MPKAEATTGLAPKKASANRPSDLAAQSLTEGFVFGCSNLTFFGGVSEERRPWAIKRE